MSKSRMPQGLVLAEFNRNKEKILALLTEGYSILDVHKFLTEENAITMGYYSLCRLVKKNDFPRNFKFSRNS